VRRAGYPFRLPMETFLRRYAMTLLDGEEEEERVHLARRHPAHATERIMAAVMPPDVVDARDVWQLGCSRVFIRSDAVLAHLEVRGAGPPPSPNPNPNPQQHKRPHSQSRPAHGRTSEAIERSASRTMWHARVKKNCVPGGRGRWIVAGALISAASAWRGAACRSGARRCCTNARRSFRAPGGW